MSLSKIDKVAAIYSAAVIVIILLTMIFLSGCGDSPVSPKEEKTGPRIMYQLTILPSDTLLIYGDHHESVNNHYAIYKDGEPVFSIQADSIGHERSTLVK